MLHFRKQGAFTLIELLIVVAIIAILAAIAVPNFLEAQTRAKISRAKSDMRTLATALESYYVDNNNYVPSAPVNEGDGANEAFLSSIPATDYSDLQSLLSNNIGTELRKLQSASDPICEAAGGYQLIKNPGAKPQHPLYGEPGQGWGYFDLNGSGGTYFHLLSTPISYISDPMLGDPFINEGNAQNVKYVACNKFMPIGFQGGGGERTVTTGTLGYQGFTPTDDNFDIGSIPFGPADTVDGDTEFDANEDSQILWWALYVVGPDKTDSVVVDNPSGGGEIRMSMMDMWASSWDTDDTGSRQGPYELDDGQIAAIVGAHVYDPTNGTKSGGEVWRLGGGRPADKTANSDGDIMINNGGQNEAYSVTSQVYKNLSQMVK